jgi:hypothetical protein
LQGDQREGAVKCSRARRLATRFISGKLDPTVGKDLETHIASCLPCASAFRVHRIVDRALNPYGREFKEAPPALKESIRACMDCCDRPGTRVCPRLRFKLRLVPSRTDDLH